MVKKTNVKQLRAIIPFIPTSLQQFANDIVQLYEQTKIPNIKTAFTMMERLNGTKKSQQKAIEAIEKYKENKTLKEKYNESLKTFTYDITGVSTILNTRQKTAKRGKKTGQLVKREYETYLYHNHKKFQAKSKTEAIQKFKEQYMNDTSQISMNGNDTDETLTQIISKVDVASIVQIQQAQPLREQYMRKLSHCKYQFIPSYDKHLHREGYCVVDTFVKYYSSDIQGNKKLSITEQDFVDLCHEYIEQGNSNSYNNGCYDEEDDYYINPLDQGTPQTKKKAEKWYIEKGVSPDMLLYICQHYDISMYAFDMTKKCFLKYISVNQNRKPLVYYAINNHMYWISEREHYQKLIYAQRATNITYDSNCIGYEISCKSDFDERKLKTNLSIQEILKLPTCDEDDKEMKYLVIQNKHFLNDDYKEIIRMTNTIPDHKNTDMEITRINYTHNGLNVIIVIDPNKDEEIKWYHVKKLCEKANITWKNQTLQCVVKEIITRFQNKKHQRTKMTIKERQQILSMVDYCCCNCKKQTKSLEIDHIIPLASGGTNSYENLQVLCKECHSEKTKDENENGYVKLSETESSFNKTTQSIFNSNLMYSYAFVEHLIDDVDEKSKIYNIDINKSRRNNLLYGVYDFPLFTVMDQPQKYNGKKAPGLYYVETQQYFPLRGNGWYYQPAIEYCLKQNLIEERDIKYVIYSSCNVPHDYFNEVIYQILDLCKDIEPSIGKRAINGMIGSFKPKARTSLHCLGTTDEANTAFYHYGLKPDNFINSFEINDKTYYQIFETHIKEKLDTEAALYHQILEQEAIELHKLTCIIRQAGGTVLDLNTDCVCATFKNNKFPFEFIHNTQNIKGFYFDDEQQIPKYKLEVKDYRLQIERKNKYVRTDTYTHKALQFNIIPENDNIHDVLINEEKNLSCHIDGRAGTGKTYLINSMLETLTSQSKKCIALAPTHKAKNKLQRALKNSDLKPMTIHKFVSKYKFKYAEGSKIDYIFIDEISMVPEYFYKYFLALKHKIPTIKFIISGDFDQLEPVNDRVKTCNYRNSCALHELVDGNRVELSLCKRADDTLFNLCDPKKIHFIQETQFKHDEQFLNLSYTNKTRKIINEQCMNRYIKLKHKKPIEFKKLEYDSNSQDVKILSGMPIIARKNNEELEIANNETFIIKQIKQTNQTIIIQSTEDGEITKIIPFDDFQKMFYVAFCITVHKSQGDTIKSPYTIHEWGMFDRRLRYVALSRATSIDHINIHMTNKHKQQEHDVFEDDD